MTKPTPRSDLVTAVREAWGIVDEAIPAESDMEEDERHEMLRAAALPVILRELLDVEVSPP
jgi:hypothetical protein